MWPVGVATVTSETGLCLGNCGKCKSYCKELHQLYARRDFWWQRFLPTWYPNLHCAQVIEKSDSKSTQLISRCSIGLRVNYTQDILNILLPKFPAYNSLMDRPGPCLDRYTKNNDCSTLSNSRHVHMPHIIRHYRCCGHLDYTFCWINRCPVIIIQWNNSDSLIMHMSYL